MVVALIVLLLTLGSLRAAGMPLLTALLGVGLTMMLIFAATGLTTVSSTTPLLAVMLGLAVGIDYALFIVSRHRDQLAAGHGRRRSPPPDAVATAGSAVVFAGLTVMIALSGLAVAGIPFLTTMGVAGRRSGSASRCCIALTLLPALLGFAGEQAAAQAAQGRARRGPAGDRDAAPGARRPAAATLGPRWSPVAGADHPARRAGLGTLAYPGQGPADRPAQQRHRRPGQPRPGSPTT